ncbi:MAG: hypothetical protein NW200_14230 [Hyphomonadaceae bacterium]|nr:hypothetical protein [Hyphomonadaceae bacterium]
MRISLFAALALLSACQPATQNAESAATGRETAAATLFEPGGDPSVFMVRAGNTVTPVIDDAGKVTSVILQSSVRGNQAVGDGNSILLKVPTSFRASASGQPVEVLISAREVPGKSPPAFYAAYSRPDVTSSGWREMRVGPEFADQMMEFTPPADVTAARTDDLVLIYADVEGLGRSVEIQSVRLKTK